MSKYHTVFGSLEHHEKGGVEVIDDDPKHYVFSNVFEVASKSKPYERVCVGKNLRYVIEAVRAEGNSPWYAAAHDEAALIMDGEVEVHLIKPDQPLVPESKEGAVKLNGEPAGRKMGWVKGGVSVPQPQTGSAADPDDPGRMHDRALGRDLSDEMREANAG